MSSRNTRSIVVAALFLAACLAGTALARPNVGGGRPAMSRPAGGMARPAASMARPAASMSRPAPAARPQISRPQVSRPQARPSTPAIQRPQVQRPAVQRPNISAPNIQRPSIQHPSSQRPSLGATGRPGLSKPSLPTASTRPAPRPGLGSFRPGGATSAPGIATRPAPAPGLSRPGGLSRPTTLPGQLGSGPGGLAGGPSTKPAFPKPTLPGKPGIGASRPGLGSIERPTTLPGKLPGGGAGDKRPGIAANRPGIGGARPSIGDLVGEGGLSGATTLPGRLPNRPGIGGINRPEIGDGNIGSGNLGIGSGNIGSGNLGNNNNFNNINVNSPWANGLNAGNWGYPGYGGGYRGGWANNWNSGYVNPHYGGWYNGCWNGNYGGGGWWAPFALGAATWGLASTIGNWGLGYGSFGYGAMGYPGGAYVNPYYSGIPSAVVASSPYDYSQPVVVNNYVTNDGDLTNSTDADGGTATAEAAPATSASDRMFDEALAKFKAGDYAAALAGCDKAVKLSPKDSVIHEVRALALFALGRYPEAAATLNAVLATAPGMDWTTMSGLYGSVDAYTTQLRKLEDFCRANPDNAAGHFVLAYHYLVGGYADMAAEALKVVVAKQPTDAVAKRLLDALTPPKEESAPDAKTPTEGTSGPAASSMPETDLVGTWKASSGSDALLLTITEDSKFTWKAMPSGKPPVQLDGTIATARDAIALESEKAGTMAGKVVSKGPDAFDFALAGAPAEAKPIAFVRQK